MITKNLDKARIKLYAWIGVGFLAIGLFRDLIQYTDTFFPRVWNNIWLISYLVVLNFIVYEYIVPYIKLKVDRIVIGIILLWMALMLYSFGFYAWRSIGIGLNLYFELTKHESVMKGVSSHFGYAVASILFFGITRYTYDHRKLKEKAQQLVIEKQEAELNYLKSQTNPHFLFNTLNNIYSLSRDKSDLAPESILRLSKIMRFMLYETSGQFIALEQEVKIMNDYIALEQLRYDDSLRVNFNYDVEDMKQAVPPLLMLPLVENAFKHGVSETRSQPFIDIHLSLNKRVLTFTVKNSAEASAADQQVKENIGLSNLRRQLQLLYTDYDLSVAHADSVFTATLRISLASHV